MSLFGKKGKDASKRLLYDHFSERRVLSLSLCVPLHVRVKENKA